MRMLAVGLFAILVLSLAGLSFWMGTPATQAESVRKSSFPTVSYKIDAGRSKFMVHAPRGGLAWFKGKSHEIAVKDFAGTAELTLDAINSASLQDRKSVV